MFRSRLRNNTIICEPCVDLYMFGRTRRVVRLGVNGAKRAGRGTRKSVNAVRFLLSLPRKFIGIAIAVIKYSLLFFIGLLLISVFTVLVL